MSAVVVALRCKICNGNKPPSSFNRIHPHQGNICENCLEWHDAALLLLGRGEPPKGCQNCGRSKATLEAETGGQPLKMYVHPKDGIYQMLCKRCSDWYSARCGHYDGTAYAHLKKLKGYK